MSTDEKREIKNVLNEIENNGKDPVETILKRYYNYIKSNREMGYDPINLLQLINESKTGWEDPEWGFPKGRRNYQEKDLDCALREFEEETGYSRHEITLIENLIPLEEIFTGSNYKIYKHRYYLAKLNNSINIKMNTFQETEISKMDWFNQEQSLQQIRPYNIEKKKVVNTVSNLLDESLFYFS